MKLFINEILLSDSIRDVNHAASVITYTYELNNEHATFNRVMQDLKFYNSYVCSQVKGEIKHYRIKE